MTHPAKSGTGAPTPKEIETRIAAAIGDLQRLAKDYQGTYLAAYGPAVVGDGGRANGTSDPTGHHALSAARERLRSGCRLAAEGVSTIHATARSGLYVLDRVMSAVDPPTSPNLRLEDQMRVSRAELRASREAQERRSARGESWGG